MYRQSTVSRIVSPYKFFLLHISFLYTRMKRVVVLCRTFFLLFFFVNETHRMEYQKLPKTQNKQANKWKNATLEQKIVYNKMYLIYNCRLFGLCFAFKISLKESKAS